MSKVTVTNIEHIDWAKRLIITYYLSQDCFNPDIGGWEYLTFACGYRNICDTEWIILTPNTQHPLHDSLIKYHGEYKYVWDYNGVQGLDPTDFDAQHSYIVQLGLIDVTCDMIDPCAFAGYETQYGGEPQGTPDTAGDIGNTYNNCGPNYYLRLDINGCPYCEPVPPTGVEPGDGPIVTGTGPHSHSVPVPWDPTNPGGSIFIPHDSTPGAPNSTAYMELVIDSTPNPNWTPGPIGPHANQIDVHEDGPGGSNPPLGQHDTTYLPESYTPGGGSTAVTDGNLGAGTNVGRNVIGTTFGGKSPTVNNPRTLSSYVSRGIDSYISPENAYNNKRRTIDQLDISPHEISALINNGVSSNQNAQKSSIVNTTRVIDAINVTDNIANARGKLPLKSDTINPSYNSFELNDIKTVPLLNSNSADSNRASNTNSQDLSISSSVLAKSPSNRNRSSNLRSALDSITFFKDTQSFASNFKLAFFSENIVRAGDGIFCEAKLVSNGITPYRYTLSIFLKTRNSIKLLASSYSVERVGHILLSKKLPVVAPPGAGLLIAIVTDIDGNVCGSKYNSITILDAGTQVGNIPTKPLVGLIQTSPVSASSSIHSLISPDQSIQMLLGAPSYYQDFIIQADSSPLSLALLSALVVSNNSNDIHAIESRLNYQTVLRSVGKSLIRGIQPVGNYSSAMYELVQRSLYSSAILRVSSINHSESTITVSLGSDFSFASFNLVPDAKSYSSSSFVLTYNDSPFSNTSLAFFDAGGTNIVPSAPVITNVTTGLDGSFTVTVPCHRKSWIGMAFANPSTAPLSSRMITWIKEDVSL